MHYEQILESNVVQGFDPLQTSHNGELRSLAAGVLVGAAILTAAGCGSSASTEKPVSNAPTTEQPMPEPASTSTSETAPIEDIEFPAPRGFNNGQFIGAITLKFANPERGNEPIADYYRSRGLTMPPQKTVIRHRLVASTLNNGVDTAETNELAQGAVLHKGSISSEAIVIGFHNVTPVQAPVEISGTTYEDTLMGINAIPQPGDKLILTVPEEKKTVEQFTYAALSSRVIDPESRTDVQSIFKPLNGKDIVRTYMCWEPGDDAHRLVVTWKLVSAQELPGTVVPVGRVSGPDVALR